MFRLVESIWIKDGNAQNLSYHQSRLNDAIRDLYNKENNFILSELIQVNDISEECKLRFLYNDNDYKIEVMPYQRRTIKKVQIVFDNKIIYKHKFIERTDLDYLFSMREDADEIIIFKDNLLTDAYYYNVVVEKNRQFYTPKKPLLRGIMREKLINEGVLVPRNIQIKDMFDYENLYLINALNPLGYVSIPIKEVML